MWTPALLQTITVIYNENNTTDVTFVIGRGVIMSIGVIVTQWR